MTEIRYMDRGWVRLHRKIQESSLWQEKPFSKGQAWADMILLARYSDGSMWVRGIEVKLKRGQLGWSQVALAEKWGWSRGKVRRFYSFLEKPKSDPKIVQHTVQHGRRLTSITTIVNYDLYNPRDTTDGTPNGQQTDRQRTGNGTGTKKGNKGKKEKKGTGKYIEPQKDPDLTANVVEYLNQTLGTNYKATTRKTKDLVSARTTEGHTLSDFKTVIDKKADEWKDDFENAKYLRPETLFGTKFEGYLNQLGGKKGAKDKEVERKEHVARLKKAIATGKDITGRRLIDHEIRKHKNELKRVEKVEDKV